MGKELKPLEIGQKFGRLTVVGKDEKTSFEKKRVYYFCQCSCGSPIKSIWKASLVDKRKPTESCGCIVKEKAGFITDRADALKRLLYEKMRDRHLHQLNDTDDTLISFEAFSARCEQPCFYCGEEKSSFKKDRQSSFVLKYNGLDRLDSNVGYRDDNTVSACKYCNIAKGEMSVEEYKEFLTRIHNYKRKG